MALGHFLSGTEFSMALKRKPNPQLSKNFALIKEIYVGCQGLGFFRFLLHRPRGSAFNSVSVRLGAARSLIHIGKMHPQYTIHHKGSGYFRFALRKEEATGKGLTNRGLTNQR